LQRDIVDFRIQLRLQPALQLVVSNVSAYPGVFPKTNILDYSAPGSDPERIGKGLHVIQVLLEERKGFEGDVGIRHIRFCEGMEVDDEISTISNGPNKIMMEFFRRKWGIDTNGPKVEKIRIGR